MKTILIVDDEEYIRAFLAFLLDGAGYRTLQAANGAQALRVLDRERPDLIISDVMMPVLDGAELCRRLKAREETRTLPVILMSTSARSTDADAFIAKPFDLNEMEELVQSLLAQAVRD